MSTEPVEEDGAGTSGEDDGDKNLEGDGACAGTVTSELMGRWIGFGDGGLSGRVESQVEIFGHLKVHHAFTRSAYHTHVLS